MNVFRSLLAGSLLTSTVFGADADFDTHWRDGKAEVSGYRLTVSRYGQERQGQAVLIYVTEPFSESKRVKVDDSRQNPADVVDVFKLNLIRDFQTGIYDYNTMVSVFVRAADFAPLKITFSSAEWCGHVFEELIFRTNTIVGLYSSYFENESGPQRLTIPPGALTEDELFIALRGLRGPFLRDGEERKVSLLPGVFFTRLHHTPLQWTPATIRRAGQRYTIDIAGGRTGTFEIEAAYPHRILRWELLPDVKAELTGTLRIPYWQLNKNGNETMLKELGLQPTVK